VRVRLLVLLAGVLASLAAAGCAGESDGTKTVTVKSQVTVETPPPKKKKKKKKKKKQQQQRNHLPKETAPAESKPAFVYCDTNIQVRDDTTTCPFAQNTFWSYWTSGQAASLQVWSAAAQEMFTTTCESDGAQVTCTTHDGGIVKFPQTAVDRYSQSQADAYASAHDLGPDPYEGLSNPGSDDLVPDYEAPDYEPEYTPPDDDTPPGENIPNYDNGRGYRVQCADGTFSQSGGIQGACSYHGGVAD
jgi:hypothetical protein